MKRCVKSKEDGDQDCQFRTQTKPMLAERKKY